MADQDQNNFDQVARESTQKAREKFMAQYDKAYREAQAAVAFLNAVKKRIGIPVNPIDANAYPPPGYVDPKELPGARMQHPAGGSASGKRNLPVRT